MPKIHTHAPEPVLPWGLAQRPDCRWCGAEMTPDRVVPHPFSDVEVWTFVCDCGARDSRVLSRGAADDDR
jgi:hypothetical protein